MNLKYPLTHIGITQGYNEITHPALDLGWYDAPNDPIYACGDGIVSRIYYFDQGGNTLAIQYDNGYNSEFMHIRDNTITVKVGDRVTFNQKVAEIGNTGTDTTGPHLHVIMRDSNSSRVDPTTVLYAYPDQEVRGSDKDRVLYYNPITYVGTPVLRDESKNQIEFTYNDIHCRQTPGLSGTILGYIRAGIYNAYNTEEVDGYTWYEIEPDKWVAYSDVWAILYPKVEQPCDCTIYENQIIEITAQNEVLKQEIENLKKELESQNPCININFIFTCKKSGMYAIQLKENEKVYIEKE